MIFVKLTGFKSKRPIFVNAANIVLITPVVDGKVEHCEIHFVGNPVPLAFEQFAEDVVRCATGMFSS